jgi:hypothetical protein
MGRNGCAASARCDNLRRRDRRGKPFVPKCAGRWSRNDAEKIEAAAEEPGSGSGEEPQDRAAEGREHPTRPADRAASFAADLRNRAIAPQLLREFRIKALDVRNELLVSHRVEVVVDPCERLIWIEHERSAVSAACVRKADPVR